MSLAIRVENVGKRYRLTSSDRTSSYRTLRESLTDAARSLFRKGEDSTRIDFWALRDVGFEIPAGQAVGIVGRNGAGKSTLLKVLSRITKPTTGRVELHGRVGSLLEVGTGFHPELSGRENIFLNGSIIGMSRREIQAKFDDIVEFAGTEKFLDTPVKRYSSGMFVRLAFSVAAHLRPEILFVDEVLAVGDASFQRRCLDLMSDLARQGCTLMFVSHNLDMIPKLCQSAILLELGQVQMIDTAETVIDRYLAKILSESAQVSLRDRPSKGNGRAKFVALELQDGHGRAITSHNPGDDIRCILDIETDEECGDLTLEVHFKTLYGTRLLTASSSESKLDVSLKPGMNRYTCTFKNVQIRPGRQLALELWLYDTALVDSIDMVRLVDIVENEDQGYSNRADFGCCIGNVNWGR